MNKSTATPDGALTWLRSVPSKYYGATDRTAAYRKHANFLTALEWGDDDTKKRGRLCQLVADGETPEMAVAIVFDLPEPKAVVEKPDIKEEPKTGNGRVSALLLASLTGLPATDPEFKKTLDSANLITVQEALRDHTITPTARKLLTARRKVLEILAEGPEPEPEPQPKKKRRTAAK